MRVLLINPSLQQERIGHYSKIIEKQRGIYPPLGLGYVASSLEKNGHEVKIIDCDAEPEHMDAFGDIIKNFDPSLVGIYTMTWTFRQAKQIAQRIRSVHPSIKIVVGGPNVSSFPKLSLKYGDFDYAVKGEGEITINELVDILEQGNRGTKLEKIRGLIYKESGRIIENAPRAYISDLDSIQFPAWHLLPMNKYFDVFAKEKRFATMITSRGCPYNCTFCDKKNRMGRTWRARSPENILDEMELLNSKYGIREFMFFDDNFIVDKDRVIDLCRLIKKRGLDVIWECRARVDQVDKSLLERMRDAGCYRIRYGMEAGDDGVLKTLNKGITVSQIRDCAKVTKEAGIEVFAYFMMGSPYETLETLKKTLNLALEMDPDFVAFSKTILIPGCDLFDWGASNGYIPTNYWESFLLGEENNPAPALSTKELPEKEVDEYVSYSNKKFYLRLKYILKRLYNTRSMTQLYRQFLIAMGLLLG